jgi:hypothetical protein
MYLAWLAGISVSFVMLERLRPLRRAQPCLRPGLLGASGKAVLIVAIVSTIWGDLNHSNLNAAPGTTRSGRPTGRGIALRSVWAIRRWRRCR